MHATTSPAGRRPTGRHVALGFSEHQACAQSTPKRWTAGCGTVLMFWRLTAAGKLSRSSCTTGAGWCSVGLLELCSHVRFCKHNTKCVKCELSCARTAFCFKSINAASQKNQMKIVHLVNMCTTLFSCANVSSDLQLATSSASVEYASGHKPSMQVRLHEKLSSY